MRGSEHALEDRTQRDQGAEEVSEDGSNCCTDCSQILLKKLCLMRLEE